MSALKSFTTVHRYVQESPGRTKILWSDLFRLTGRAWLAYNERIPKLTKIFTFFLLTGFFHELYLLVFVPRWSWAGYVLRVLAQIYKQLKDFI